MRVHQVGDQYLGVYEQQKDPLEQPLSKLKRRPFINT